MKALLIPSATLIPREMRSRMGAIPTCLFPLNNGTMLQQLCQKYDNYTDKIYVLANKGEEQIRNYVELKKLPVQIVKVDELKDLGYTIRCGLEALQEEVVEQIYINFADTLLSNPPSMVPRDIVYYAKQDYDEDWSFFEQENGTISQIMDKCYVPNGPDRQGNVFVGVFEITRPDYFIEELVHAQEQENADQDSFYTALKEYSRQTAMEFFLASKWFDVGHSERYIQAKTSVEARAFNSIEIDESRGILKKRSKNQEKLINEIKWYLKMPAKLQYLIPRIYDYSLDWSDPYVSMEYYGYNTFHEMLVYGDNPQTQWRQYFEKLLFAVQDMGRFQVHGSRASISSSLETMYITKVVERLGALRNDSRFSSFFSREIYVNGAKFPSLDLLITKLPQMLKKRLIDNAPDKFCIIHGDLCFSNILVEDRFGFMRIIDPRGKFGEFDLYGDQRYELAKLMHSMDGQYDFITEDMFSVQVDETNIVLEVPNKASGVYTIFKDVFREMLANYADLQLIESTLFLSMLPLHNDSLSRQYAMLATGLKLLYEAAGGALNG